MEGDKLGTVIENSKFPNKQPPGRNFIDQDINIELWKMTILTLRVQRQDPNPFRFPSPFSSIPEISHGEGSDYLRKDSQKVFRLPRSPHPQKDPFLADYGKAPLRLEVVREIEGI